MKILANEDYIKKRTLQKKKKKSNVTLNQFKNQFCVNFSYGLYLK